MADNLLTQAATLATIPTATNIAARAVTYSGDANTFIAPTGLVSFAGADDAKTATDVPLPTALGANGGIKVDIVGDTGTPSTLDTDDGSVAASQASIALTIPLRYTWNGAAWVRGGYTPFKAISAASTNGANVKNAPGVVGVIAATNINAAVRYLKLYNKATAPTVGTDVPVLVFAIPGSTTGGGTNIPIPDVGIAFSLGIGIGITTGVADNDTGAVGANDLVINLGYL